MSLTSLHVRESRPAGLHAHPSRLLVVALGAVGLLVISLVWGQSPVSILGLSLGGTLLIIAGFLTGKTWFHSYLDNKVTDTLMAWVQHDSIPSFVATRTGKVRFANAAAQRAHAGVIGQDLSETLRATFADPASILTRLQSLASKRGIAREDIITLDASTRVSALCLVGDQVLWRLEPVPTEAVPDRATSSLPFPVLTVGSDDKILDLNIAAKSLFTDAPRRVEDVVQTSPIVSGRVHQVATARGVRPHRVIEHMLSPDRRQLYVFPNAAAPADFDDVDALPVAMVCLDARGHVLRANSAARRLLGPDVCEGCALSDLMEGLGRPVRDWIEDAVSKPGSLKSEFLRLTRSDKEAFVQVTLSPSKTDAKEDLIAIMSDATELKTLEAQFVQSQKMQAIGQLAGGVAHDFNNLLTAISGHCDLMLLRHDPGDEDYADLMQITQNANRAAALVGQLLAFSRKQTLRPETLCVRETLSDLTHLLNRLVGEKVRLTLVHDSFVGAIRADKRQLEQVLMNLVVNARDAMPDGGEIKIVTEGLILDAPLARDRVTLDPGQYVSVKVIDEGCGIPGDQIQKVFEPFFTTKRTGEGTGLGLSTAYGIVKQTGGFIFVDSTLDAGTCFSVIFPVRENAEPSPVASLPEPRRLAPKHGQGVVLLVEDEAPVRAFASRALNLRGYTVVEAESAETALATLQDRDLHVDVFVTDIVMPGMDGPTWVKEALETRPDVRVVFMSGYAEGAIGATHPDLPNSRFLQKPFSLEDLVNTVHDLSTSDSGEL